MILRANFVLPITRPPIAHGAVRISGNRITKVAAWRQFGRSNEAVFDLGDSILLPGLVNAHCHLDYTGMAGMIAATKKFSDWIKAILALKAQWSYSEYAQSWLRGANMLLHSGTTTVADIEAVPELLPDVWSATPLRIISFLELTNVKSRRAAADIVGDAAQKIRSLKNARCFAALSPHSLYATSPDLLECAASIAQKNNYLLSTHVAESADESQMFEQKSGPLFEWLKNQRAMSGLGLSPVRYLERHGMLSERFLAVHANYISKGDAELLAQKHCSVVHCPRSHDYFGHQKFPYKLLRSAGVNVCLGTDSLASVRPVAKKETALNLFSDMQFLAQNHPYIDSAKILQMTTVNAAEALRLNAGRIEPGSFADLIALPFVGKAADIYEAVVQFPGKVPHVIGSGQWIIRDGVTLPPRPP